MSAGGYQQFDGPDQSVFARTIDCISDKLFLKDKTKRCIWILFLANLLNYMDRFTVAGVLTHLIDEFDLTQSNAGFLQTVFIIAYMCSSPIFGYLGDRYSRKLIIACGLTVWSAAVLACTFVPPTMPWLFFTLRALVGVGEASYAIVTPSLISDIFFDTERSRMIMYFCIAIPFGSGLGYILGSSITNWTGSWRWGLRLTPILGIFVLYLIAKKLKEPSRGQVDLAAFESTSLKQDMRYLAKIPTFWYCTIAFTCNVFVIGALSWWTPTMAEYAYGSTHGDQVPEYAKANISSVFGIITCAAGLVGVAFGTRLSTFFRHRAHHDDAYARADPIICAAGVLCAAPLMFMALVVTIKSMLVGWIVVFCAVTCMCINWAVNTDMLMYVVMPSRRSFANSLQTTIAHVFGDAASPYLVGYIADSIRGDERGLLPSCLVQYSALQYALFAANFMLVFSGAFYLLASFYVSEDADQCILEIQRGQHRQATFSADSPDNASLDQVPEVVPRDSVAVLEPTLERNETEDANA